MWKWFFQLGSPPTVYALSRVLQPWFLLLGLALLLYGCWQGLFVAPADYQQKDAFRIIYVHVPAAYLSMMAYSIVGIASAIGLIWRMKMAHALAEACAPIGAAFTALALATGSIWGRPMWGTWWEWGDPRLTSELILLFLYVGFMVLRNSITDPAKADRAGALLAIVGLVNIPIIHYSVEWWSSLHQGATLIREGGPAMPSSMLVPLLYCLGGFTLFFAGVVAQRLRAVVIRRERRARWMQNLLESYESVAWPAPLLRSVQAITVAAFLLFGISRAMSLPWISRVAESMSGYGVYVWTSFALAAIVLLGNLAGAANQHNLAAVSGKARIRKDSKEYSS